MRLYILEVRGSTKVIEAHKKKKDAVEEAKAWRADWPPELTRISVTTIDIPATVDGMVDAISGSWKKYSTSFSDSHYSSVSY